MIGHCNPTYDPETASSIRLHGLARMADTLAARLREVALGRAVRQPNAEAWNQAVERFRAIFAGMLEESTAMETGAMPRPWTACVECRRDDAAEELDEAAGGGA